MICISMEELRLKVFFDCLFICIDIWYIYICYALNCCCYAEPLLKAFLTLAFVDVWCFSHDHQEWLWMQGSRGSFDNSYNATGPGPVISTSSSYQANSQITFLFGGYS